MSAYCGLCGAPTVEGDHTSCIERLLMEPPRYCVRCRRRMKVQVTPRGWAAACVEHGPVTR